MKQKEWARSEGPLIIDHVVLEEDWAAPKFLHPFILLYHAGFQGIS